MKKILLLAPISSQSYSYQGLERIKAYLTREGFVDVTLLYHPMEGLLTEASISLYAQFDIIGMSIYAELTDVVFELFKNVKKINRSIYTVVGSMFASHCADSILQDCAYVDFVVHGNGEVPLKEVISQLSEKNDLSALSLNEHISVQGGDNRGKIPYKADIRNLPWPARENPYETEFVHITTKEGCAGRCTFCSSHSDGYNEEMQRAPRDIIEEMIHINKNRKIDNFFITDGIFEGIGKKGKDRIREFCAMLEQIPQKFSFTCYMRPQSIKEYDLDMLIQMRSVGFHTVITGVESANAPDLRLYGKANTKEDSYRAIQIIEKSGMNPKFGFIMLNPYSTLEKIQKNVEFLASIKTYYIFHYYSKLQVYHNSLIYKKLRSDEMLTSEYSYKQHYGYKFADKTIKRLDEEISWLINGGLGVMDRNLSETAEIINVINTKYHDHEFIQKCKGGINDLFGQIANQNELFFRNLFFGGNRRNINVLFAEYERTVNQLINELSVYKKQLLKYDIKNKRHAST